LILALFAVIVAAVAVVWAETNAARFARGMPPLPPRNMYTPVAAAKRGHPSGSPKCSASRTAECCASVVPASDPTASLIMELLGTHVGGDVVVGLTCYPLGSETSCPPTQQAVCCKDTRHEDICAIDCVYFDH